MQFIKSLLYVCMISLFSLLLFSCDSTDESDENSPNTINNSNNTNIIPPWESSVITPLRVVEYAPEGQPLLEDTYGFNNPEKALGLPKGSGESAGSQDVVSLGFDEDGLGGYIILEFDKKIINGPGTDFKVFENTFKNTTDSYEYFIEAAIVYLSEDGINWYEYPNSFTGDVANIVETGEPSNYSGFAGLEPVITNRDKGDSPKPEDALSGGDFFDLENMTSPIKENGFYFIKIVDAGVTILDPGNDTDENGDYIFKTNGFDLDAVVGIHYE